MEINAYPQVTVGVRVELRMDPLHVDVVDLDMILRVELHVDLLADVDADLLHVYPRVIL